MGCTCKNIVPQSKECYEQQIVVKVPNWITITGCTGEKKESVCLDPCIAAEVIELWRKGIVTTGCCCGHKKHPAYIGVMDEFIPSMKKLGYEVQPNNSDFSREDSFYPMSVGKPETLKRGDLNRMESVAITVEEILKPKHINYVYTWKQVQDAINKAIKIK